MTADTEEILQIIAKYTPSIAKKMSIATPTHLFDIARKTMNIKKYDSLIREKLGLTF
jgi:hypothetical protein